MRRSNALRFVTRIMRLNHRLLYDLFEVVAIAAAGLPVRAPVRVALGPVPDYQGFECFFIVRRNSHRAQLRRFRG